MAVIARFLKLIKEIVSLTGLNLSFCDLGCFNFDILLSKVGRELPEVQSLGTLDFSDMPKVILDVNKQGIDRLVLCGNKVLQQLTQATFHSAPEKALREKNHQ